MFTEMASEIPELASLVSEAQTAFSDTYGGVPTIAVAAPGRVNIIGEHTDYNDGFVFPMVRQNYQDLLLMIEKRMLVTK